jgi:ubiquinone/menaquinone biosynthesis C-methylase UbiE
MTLSIESWNERYQQQARWTKPLRDYLYNKIGIKQTKRILEVGCGTGVILEELSHISSNPLFGVDINPAVITFAHNSSIESNFSIGDAFYLPFHSNTFDISLCHFLLLWIQNPAKAIIEMTRVLLPGGCFLALAEPDYGGRIDFPFELSQIGNWQIKSLMEQGANPYIGRELRSLLVMAGLSEIEVGILGGQWDTNLSENEIELEWKVIKSDLSTNNEFIKSAAYLQELDQIANKNHHRILFVPTFYAMGKKRI